MKQHLILFFALLSFSSFAAREFEGIITYQVTITSKDPRIDLKPIYEIFGKTQQFFFKAGMHKWYNPKGLFEYEIYNPRVDSLNLFSKERTSDTIYLSSLIDTTNSVSDTYVSKSEKICGIDCKSQKFFLTNGVVRTIYCPSDTLICNPDYYTHFKSQGELDIITYCHSIPLKLVLELKQNLVFTYTAKKIQWKQLSESEFSLDKTKPTVKKG